MSKKSDFWHIETSDNHLSYLLHLTVGDSDIKKEIGVESDNLHTKDDTGQLQTL